MVMGVDSDFVSVRSIFKVMVLSRSIPVLHKALRFQFFQIILFLAV